MSIDSKILAEMFPKDRLQRTCDYFSRLFESEIKEGIIVDDDEMVAFAGEVASFLSYDKQRDTLCREVEKVTPLDAALKSGMSSEDAAAMCRNYGEGKRLFTKYNVLQVKRCFSVVLAYINILEGKK